MKYRMLLILVAGAALFAAAADAHHSRSATYQTTEQIKLEGKLVQFAFRNPHSFVHVEAPDENGMMQRWAVEWSGAAALQGQGVQRDTLRAGDQVIVTGFRSRSAGQFRVLMSTLRRPLDGFAWGVRPGEVVD